MTVQTYTGEQSAWDGQVREKGNSEFLQSWGWGAFQERLGRTVERLVIEGTQEQHFLQCIRHTLVFGAWYAYVPRSAALSGAAWDALGAWYKKEGALFVRAEPGKPVMPPVDAAASLPPHDLSAGARPSKNRQPRRTLVVDLTQSDDALLSAMHPKTRYNIKLAERKGVRVQENKTADAFCALLKETAARDKFGTHPDAYYRAMIDSGIATVFTAWYEGRPIAAHVCILFGKTMTYLHGASGNVHRNLMAPYLLQWEQIRYGKTHGATAYDFWGIAPAAENGKENGKHPAFHGLAWDVRHSWSGITRFKAGFGGTVKEYPQGFDLPLRTGIYSMYTMVKKML